ncbi:putative spermidine/putrescine transport system ATP-binding protein [Microbacterium endophyticum]|uniref:ABC-type quaternary amine transporter n=1 Tax=Microbacterium endophyticum TaxID=1526412 RepID=A0A7W4V1X4_9MICO|nr:ABC transporter ATP-binding protein [Microbacterium endophyticum]MBB2975362.1 putative spermidine/putrescine transport system ATP-binding protein [Microbacterium endophyticum]NIK35619.1 putative spermidine/putrescine transport system ATP-binding protein [Microbacterium endophyticum]
MTIALSISDINVTLGHNHVLKGVTLDVRPGEFVTLLGASGSGKSTLLNVIAGLQRADSGHVLFDGLNVEDMPPQKRNVGVVFQSYALFPHMSIGENVAFPLRAARRPRKARQDVANEMLSLVQLSDMSDRSPASLSGGQRQRVALARALAADPGILLLDEPMAALDKQLREQMQVEITRIQRKVGITTVSVTHDQTEALTMSDRVAIMRDGLLVQVDSPEALYRRPVDEYVASFLGEANLLPTVDGKLIDETPSGAHDIAVIRPEDLALVTSDLPAPAWSIEGIVRLVSFQGTRYRLELLTSAGRKIVCSLPTTIDPASLSAGAVVRVACSDASHVHVIKAASSTESAVRAA